MEISRRTRAEETRESTAPRKLKWEPPSNLPEPNHREGWRHRWCATSVQGDQATVMMQKRLAEGWVPVNGEEYPEVTTRIHNHPGKGEIHFGGMILCRMPVELAESRAEYFANQNRTEMAGVRKDLAQLQNQNRRYGHFVDENHAQQATVGRPVDFGDGN